MTKHTAHSLHPNIRFYVGCVNLPATADAQL